MELKLKYNSLFGYPYLIAKQRPCYFHFLLPIWYSLIYYLQMYIQHLVCCVTILVILNDMHDIVSIERTTAGNTVKNVHKASDQIAHRVSHSVFRFFRLSITRRNPSLTLSMFSAKLNIFLAEYNQKQMQLLL